ncbi:MAG TPA: VOC family protein [Pseudonocardia sp.]|jgi:catechol 2,3-dioxygenase|nr:VOC family protein [Pseudonocardia sp.]
MSYQPRIRDIAHVGSVELFTPCLAETTDFFVRLMSLDEVARRGDSVYLHAWDDYEAWTLKITQRDLPGIGRTYLRASDPAALQRRVDALTSAEVDGTWSHDEPAFGPTWVCADPDGHEFGLYWESAYFRAAAEARPALKNQAAPFPGRGANVRRLDHVNYLTGDVAANDRFVEGLLKARPTEQIVLDDGARAAVWYSVSDKSYDLVYTADWTTARGRLHHIAFATDTREDILRAADVFLEAGIHIETGPHKHAIQQTFFLYVWEPGGNRVELCNAGARLLLAPDWPVVSWTQAERAKGQAWGLQTISTFHTHGTPPAS